MTTKENNGSGYFFFFGTQSFISKVDQPRRGFVLQIYMHDFQRRFLGCASSLGRAPAHVGGIGIEAQQAPLFISFFIASHKQSEGREKKKKMTNVGDVPPSHSEGRGYLILVAIVLTALLGACFVTGCWKRET